MATTPPFKYQPMFEKGKDTTEYYLLSLIHIYNGMNDTGYYSYLPYFTLYKFVKSANDVIAAVDVTDPTITDEMRGLGSISHAFRALDYYTLMVLFEPVENI